MVKQVTTGDHGLGRKRFSGRDVLLLRRLQKQCMHGGGGVTVVRNTARVRSKATYSSFQGVSYPICNDAGKFGRWLSMLPYHSPALAR